MTAGEIAEAAQLTTGAVTGVLDHLEASGWVRRVRDTVDRRRVRVELTDRIERESPAVYGPLLADSEELLRSFSDEQLAVIVDFVRRERGLLTKHSARLREILRARRDTAGTKPPAAG